VVGGGLRPEVGWAIGDGKEHGEDTAWDAAEVEQLYTLLEQQIVPEFYDRDAQGLPTRWLERVRESMARLTPSSPPVAPFANIPTITTCRRPQAIRDARPATASLAPIWSSGSTVSPINGAQ